MEFSSRGLLGLSLATAIFLAGGAAAYAALIAILFPHVGSIVLGLLCLEAALLFGLIALAPTWPARRGARWGLVVLVIVSALPHAMLSGFGWLALGAGIELAMYSAHALALAAALGCASRLARAPDAPPRTAPRRALVVLTAGCLGATVLVLAHFLTFVMARDRDAVLSACEALSPGRAGVQDVRAAARREHLTLPRYGVPEDGSTWMARELVGVRGWQCTLRLEHGAVIHAHADPLILD